MKRSGLAARRGCDPVTSLTGEDAVAGGQLLHAAAAPVWQQDVGGSREARAPLAVAAERGSRLRAVARARLALLAQSLHLKALRTTVLLRAENRVRSGTKDNGGER